MNVKVKLYNKSTNPNPVYAKPGDSGMDVMAAFDMVIRPGATVMITTGLHFGLPEGYEIQVRPRSGKSLKTKFRVANSPGTLDQGYTGELCVIADNIGENDELIKAGERIAQIVLQEVPKMEFVQVFSQEELGNTERGATGFGSSGSH
jgi:dUTP pyrophosphatase